MRARVQDLIGDDAKRRAFGTAAHASVQGRTWPALCSELIHHYQEAIAAVPVSATSINSKGAKL